MAYNYYPGYYQQMPQMPQMQPQQQQIQNSGFVSVRSIEEAFNWPVAPGNSITFKDENAPYVYTKTKGFSPLEQPVFERYRLVKEEDAVRMAPNQPAEAPNYDEQIKLLWAEVNAIKGQITPSESKSEKPVKRRDQDEQQHDE